MFRNRIIWVVCCCLVFVESIRSQSVGVVLSGGGAQALAHIGVLRELEENQIPVDYIVGTSMGAMIAGMYAAGFDLDSIESFVRTPDFVSMSEGVLDDRHQFLFYNWDPDAGMVGVHFGKEVKVNTLIPTHMVVSEWMDWHMLEQLAEANRKCKGDFNQLLVPFRCVAADVEHKRQVVFEGGQLNEAIRASLTYPFYIPPIRVEGNLLFDGGIYNNFPVDIMYKEFLPDVIIGSNVSGNPPAPQEGDLLSQLETLVMFRELQDFHCEGLVLIEPKVGDMTTFSFDAAGQAIAAGRAAAKEKMALIQSSITRRCELQEVALRRKKFNTISEPIHVDGVSIDGVSEREKSKWERKFLGKKSQPQVHDLERSFFSLFQDQRVKNVFPMLTYNPTTEKNTLVLKVKKNPEIRVEAGGVFSSRSINTGYLGLEYYPFSQRNFKLVGRSYFGRFYGSALGEINWGTSSFKRPMVLKLSYIQNRWDYYKSISTFFEDIKPSFVVLNEQVFKLGSVIATGQHHVLQCESMYSHQYDKYYQTNQFLSVDTADQTRFDAWISRIKWQYNDLNRKQYASEGMMLDFAYKYVKGFEQTIPGSTNLLRDTTHQWHDWSVFSIKLIAYQRVSDFLSFGIRFQDLWSSQGAFNNYMASIINSPVFQPTPESATYFLPTFRATHYAAIGGMGVIGITDKLDARLESHWFFSGMQFADNPDHSTGVNRTITRSVIQSGALVYHSPVGPVSLQVNYYERKAVPWGVAFHFGYILFNDSPRD